MEKWRCIVCGYIYDPKVGDPESGLEPGVPFKDLPDRWGCPECGASTDSFERIEEPEPLQE